MRPSLETQRLIALLAVAVLLFNAPLQQLWNGRALALFGVWALVIGVLAWLMERGDASAEPPPGTPAPAAPPPSASRPADGDEAARPR
jgi:hypothetical protein